MYRTKMCLALASVVCVCSVSSAQDFVLSQLNNNGHVVDASRGPSGRQTVSTLPSDIFGEPSHQSSSIDYAAEEAAVRRANTLVLIGIVGLLVASLSAAGLFIALRRKGQSANAGMQLVGI